MRISTSQLLASNLSGINQQSAALVKAQRQLATGTKLQTASDNPAAAARIVEINRSIDRNDQFQLNGVFASNRLDLSETTLTAVDAAVNRINALIASSDQQTTVRQQISTQIKDELSILIDLSNVRDTNGDYLYAGTSTNQKPFDDSGANVVYTGNDVQRSIQIGPDRRVADGDTGQAVFEDISGGRSLFQIVEDAITVLDNPASTAAAIDATIRTSITDLNLATDNITTIRNSIASRTRMINTEAEIQQQISETLKDQRSNLNEIDFGEIAIRISQLQTSISAAQQTFVKTQELSLFNFL